MYCQKTDSFSGEVFKENFTDIFYTNLEQIAFSIAFPIKHTVKRKPSLFVEKKPKDKVSLHIKIGDYLSSGDKIGEKKSNIREPHYVNVASHLRTNLLSTQGVAIVRKRKSKMMRCYVIRARLSSASALACKCKTKFCKRNKSSFNPKGCNRTPCLCKCKISFCITEGDRSDTKLRFVITRCIGWNPIDRPKGRCKKICMGKGKANKSKRFGPLGPRTPLALYGQQLRFASGQSPDRSLLCNDASAFRLMHHRR